VEVNAAFAAALAGGVVDTAVGVPKSREEMFEFYEFIRRQTRDAESKKGEGGLEFPAGYMFKEPVHLEADELGDDPVEYLKAEHDRWGITKAILNVDDGGNGARAVRENPGRFYAGISVDPNTGMEAVRRIDHFAEEFDLKSVGMFGAGMIPQVALNDKKLYPVYAKCVELDIAFCATTGVPGPRIPFGVQDVALLDEVCWFFPELRFVMRHGAEPWADLAVKLMLKWPNLYYSTTAFAPKYYPKDVVDFANTRGADKFIWSGYFPAGLSYERIFSELPDVPLRDHVWPKFLRENATRVFRLD
jgi:predicted TIM-barrel fold metal-dependent hydrolase